MKLNEDRVAELLASVEAECDEYAVLMFRSAVDNLRAPWYLRARRRVAFFVAHRLHLVTLGYVIDYDRDRYASGPRPRLNGPGDRTTRRSRS